MAKSIVITEDTQVEFRNYDQLSYEDFGDPKVFLYIDGKEAGRCPVWKDSEMDGREYICLNQEIVYLDTLKKIN